MPTVVAAWTKVIVDYAAHNGIDVTRPDVAQVSPGCRIWISRSSAWLVLALVPCAHRSSPP
jgi:hypothetical protein